MCCCSGAGLSSSCCCGWFRTAAAGVMRFDGCDCGAAAVGVFVCCCGALWNFGSGVGWAISAEMRMAKLRSPGFARGAALLFDGGGAGAVDWPIDLLDWAEAELAGGIEGSGVCGVGKTRGICGS